MSSRGAADTSATPDRQRLDKWLWHARFARTRPLASGLVTDGYVRVNGTRCVVPGRQIRIGDVLTLSLSRTVVVVEVRGFAERRGPAEAARPLYDTVRAPEA